MALRGDSVDNIPGAPGIGDKGSVEIIKRFGTVEQALDRANEVEKKTYRESLQNNRDTILFSKSMATIDTNVPVDLNVEAMRAGQPDLDLLRQLFTELEFTSLLKELLPEVQVTETHYNEAQSAADVESVFNSVALEAALAIAVELEEAEPPTESDEEKLTKKPAIRNARTHRCLIRCAQPPSPPPAASPSPQPQASATIVKLDSTSAAAKLRHILDRRHTQSNPRLQSRNPRARFPRHPLQGVEHDPMLYSYLLDPTYSSHRLADVALRRFNLKD